MPILFDLHKKAIFDRVCGFNEKPATALVATHNNAGNGRFSLIDLLEGKPCFESLSVTPSKAKKQKLIISAHLFKELKAASFLYHEEPLYYELAEFLVDHYEVYVWEEDEKAFQHPVTSLSEFISCMQTMPIAAHEEIIRGVTQMGLLSSDYKIVDSRLIRKFLKEAGVPNTESVSAPQENEDYPQLLIGGKPPDAYANELAATREVVQYTDDLERGFYYDGDFKQTLENYQLSPENIKHLIFKNVTYALTWDLRI